MVQVNRQNNFTIKIKSIIEDLRTIYIYFLDF